MHEFCMEVALCLLQRLKIKRVNSYKLFSALYMVRYFLGDIPYFSLNFFLK